MGDLKISPKLKYHTNIFATDPIPHQTIYHLEKQKILAEKKSFPCVMSPASVKKVFLHSPWQNMQKIETMFPLQQRVKLCWFGHQRIRMEW